VDALVTDVACKSSETGAVLMPRNWILYFLTICAVKVEQKLNSPNRVGETDEGGGYCEIDEHSGLLRKRYDERI
jgi:hypothetical protein